MFPWKPEVLTGSYSNSRKNSFSLKLFFFFFSPQVNASCAFNIKNICYVHTMDQMIHGMFVEHKYSLIWLRQITEVLELWIKLKVNCSPEERIRFNV